ncbi:MAG: O-antigen ligase family protein [Burkholderiaceae bacterium]|nr:O-antigen ligase family protein [Burkholderiaceae bacterium]
MPLLLPVLGGNATPHDVSRALQTGLMAFCGLAALPTVAAARLRWPVMFLLLAAAVTTLRADRLEMAWREAASYLGLIAVAVTVAVALAQPRLRRLLQWAVVAATGLYAVAVLTMALMAGVADAPLQHSELIFGYANRRHFNHVQTVAVLLCLLVATEASDRRLRRLAILAAICSLALLVLTFGRATVVAGLSGVLAASWAARSTRLLRLATACVVVGLVLHLAVFQLWPLTWGRVAAPSVDHAMNHLAGDQSRIALWAWAWSAWCEAPWFGIGPMHLAQRFNGIVAHPHNLLLQFAAEWGAVALALASILVAGFMYRLWLASRHKPAAAGGLALVVAVLVDGLFSGNAVMPVSQVWIAVAAGWAWQVQATGANRSAPARWADPAVWMGWLLALVLMSQPVALAVITARDWSGLPGSLEAARVRYPSEQNSPRFWSHGWF